MKNYYVVNKYTGHLMGSVRATSIEAAKTLARTLLGSYATAEL